MEAKHWYVVHTYSGYENKVKTNLEKRVQSMDMQEKIFRVLVPMEDEIEIKDGKQKMVKRKTFPGYVLVEMDMTDESWYVVRNTPGVTGFVGSGNKPIPLAEDEVKAILGAEHAKGTPNYVVNFDIDQPVHVVSGPFKGTPGVIKELFPERGKARILVTVMGRDTPVEVDFGQIEEI